MTQFAWLGVATEGGYFRTLTATPCPYFKLVRKVRMMGNKLYSLLDESHIVSLDEVINAIHRHIGNDKDIKEAELILGNIFFKLLEQGNPDLDLFYKGFGLWKPLLKNEHGRYAVTDKYSYQYYQYENFYLLLIALLKERQEYRDLPF